MLILEGKKKKKGGKVNVFWPYHQKKKTKKIGGQNVTRWPYSQGSAKKKGKGVRNFFKTMGGKKGKTRIHPAGWDGHKKKEDTQIPFWEGRGNVAHRTKGP